MTIPLISALLRRAFPKKPEPIDVKDEPQRIGALDPLLPNARGPGWEVTNDKPNPFPLTVADFPMEENSEGVQKLGLVGDAALKPKLSIAMDDGQGVTGAKASAYQVPELLQDWYISQGFIGYQACAIIAQHWLVNKACSQSGEDAIRNGWTIKAKNENDELEKDKLDALTDMDKEFRIKDNLTEMHRFKNIFGIRVCIFEIESDDADFYEKPFNLDGVTPDSYKGVSQIDPYWMTPMLTAKSTSNPAGRHFYEPEFWIISGKKYHRTHLNILRGPQPADILKPTYNFGGMPLTQMIYERVYAAERTANEAPLLAMSKRTSVLHADMEKVAANEAKFTARLMRWIANRDNHGVKVLNTDESMEQFDTALGDLDAVIMNQYQLVAAIAKTPATKILGTSPKGFNATGEFETVSYHEELESIQEHEYVPFLERHYSIASRSLDINIDLLPVMEAVDSVSASTRADLNYKKAQTAELLINSGQIAPDEARASLRDDKHSGFNRLTDEEAETKIGMSPENIAELTKADSDQDKGQAALASSGNGEPEDGPNADQDITSSTRHAPVEALPAKTSKVDVVLNSVIELLKLMEEENPTQMSDRHRAVLMSGDPEAYNFDPDVLRHGDAPHLARTSKPGTEASANAHVAGIRANSKDVTGLRLPKIKGKGGFVFTIENPAGTIRKGMDIKGKQWAAKMQNHYGFINSTMGADGDEVDCFVGPNQDAQMVYVINQNDPYSKQFDEHKCMIGFDDEASAKAAYTASFNAGWSGFDSIVPMTLEEFRAWLGQDCTMPAAAKVA